MRLMGAEGLFQACCDRAAQTVLAYGGSLDDLPDWPVPRRYGLSTEKLPPPKLVP